MTQGAGTVDCPKGHASTEPDYCSECGAKIGGVGEARATAQGFASFATGEICPDCGTVREQNDVAFCEVCGFNFETGAHGEVGTPPAPQRVEPVALQAGEAPGHEDIPQATVLADPRRWRVRVSVDPSLKVAGSPEPPENFVPYTIELDQLVSLIGRPNEARGIFPEIALAFDEAVSRRHALLQKDAQGGLLLRDIGAANGTRLNGEDLPPMVDRTVQDGDEITLGHWTRLRIQSQ